MSNVPADKEADDIFRNPPLPDELDYSLYGSLARAPPYFMATNKFPKTFLHTYSG
jgi:hypothetical protein